MKRDRVPMVSRTYKVPERTARTLESLSAATKVPIAVIYREGLELAIAMWEREIASGRRITFQPYVKPQEETDGKEQGEETEAAAVREGADPGEARAQAEAEAAAAAGRRG